MSTAAFRAERRAYFARRAQEDWIRNSSLHYLAELLGIAPNLATDTPYERLLKKYPRYAHVVIAECLDHKWKVRDATEGRPAMMMRPLRAASTRPALSPQSHSGRSLTLPASPPSPRLR